MDGGDFTNEAHERGGGGVDCVIHSLCTTLPKSSNDNPVYDISSNLVSTLHLLRPQETRA
jgi:UDP-glucose 4-epimerase